MMMISEYNVRFSKQKEIFTVITLSSDLCHEAWDLVIIGNKITMIIHKKSRRDS